MNTKELARNYVNGQRRNLEVKSEDSSPYRSVNA